MEYLIPQLIIFHSCCLRKLRMYMLNWKNSALLAICYEYLHSCKTIKGEYSCLFMLSSLFPEVKDGEGLSLHEYCLHSLLKNDRNFPYLMKEKPHTCCFVLCQWHPRLVWVTKVRKVMLFLAKKVNFIVSFTFLYIIDCLPFLGLSSCIAFLQFHE